MSIAISPGESRVLLTGVSWSTYEALLADTQCRGTRFTYDRGYLEISIAGQRHVCPEGPQSGLPLSSLGEYPGIF